LRAPVQVTEQVLGGDTVRLKQSEMEQVKRLGAPVQVTEQVVGGDTVHLNPSEMEQVKKWELQFR
jgi:hypothetical protein